ncbi:DUF3267 domain-containing protein [Nodosilinea sp. LEGE 07088]|uniref:DUF3267 domain-containing protein n=1 Tax=Nodosilinea sp. LEGE 07088 TaxID=2777968 RepID=UPI00187F5710|nr:DUF3267 domain-containing protein [Nodosilinea sp. LEGE 07088]MBE9140818.1 DUF3267 domain-containing protein [Nodosilinea sp. LEGE 07088]
MMLGLVLFSAISVAVSKVYTAIHQQHWIPPDALELTHPWDYGRLAALFALPIATPALYGCLHGLTLKAFGGTPHFGVGAKHLSPYTFVTAFGQRFTRNAFLVSKFIPLVIINITALGLLMMFPRLAWLGWVVALNTAGAVGDLWMASLVCRYPASVNIEDQRDGFAIYGPGEGSRSQIQSGDRHSVWPANLWQIIHLTLIVFVLLTLMPLSLLIPFDILKVPPFQLTVGGQTFFRWMQGREGFSISFRPLVAALLAPAIALAIASASRGLRR